MTDVSSALPDLAPVPVVVRPEPTQDELEEFRRRTLQEQSARVLARQNRDTRREQVLEGLDITTDENGTTILNLSSRKLIVVTNPRLRLIDENGDEWTVDPTGKTVSLQSQNPSPVLDPPELPPGTIARLEDLKKEADQLVERYRFGGLVNLGTSPAVVLRNGDTISFKGPELTFKITTQPGMQRYAPWTLPVFSMKMFGAPY